MEAKSFFFSCSYKNEPYTPLLFCRGSNGLKGFSSVSLPSRHFQARGDMMGSSHLEFMHVQYSLSETTRIHDLSTRKMHLIRGNRRTAVLTNRTICTIRESLLRPVSIRVLRVIVVVCRLFLSTRKRQNNTVAQLSPLRPVSTRLLHVVANLYAC